MDSQTTSTTDICLVTMQKNMRAQLGRSEHAKKVNIGINETWRVVVGCLRSTPLSKLYELVPDIRRNVAAKKEIWKASYNGRYPLYCYERIAESQVKSRRSIFRIVAKLKNLDHIKDFKYGQLEIIIQQNHSQWAVTSVIHFSEH